MQNPYRARVDERHFLNHPGFHGGAYVYAYVEDTSGRDLERDTWHGPGPWNVEPRMILEMADCDRRIALEFEIDTAMQRMNSFHKIETLIAALVAFRDGMAAEAELYRAREERLRELREAAKREKEEREAAKREEKRRAAEARHLRRFPGDAAAASANGRGGA